MLQRKVVKKLAEIVKTYSESMGLKISDVVGLFNELVEVNGTHAAFKMVIREVITELESEDKSLFHSPSGYEDDSQSIY